jgi:hypothetical protein
MCTDRQQELQEGQIEIERRVMESLDRFFDVYERIVPRCFGDVLAAVVVVSVVAWVVV